MESDSPASEVPKRTPTSRFKLPKLDASLSESLTAGTSIPPPPPTPPPKDARPMTIEKITLSVQQPELPIDYRPSTSTTMPGAFPTSPLDSPSAGPQTPSARPRTENDQTDASGYPLPSTPSTTSPKRPGSLRNLFRPLSRFYSNSSDSQTTSPRGLRPALPSGTGMGSVASPSLNHKKSGSFWDRRKSSLGLMVEGAGQNGSTNGGTNGNHTVGEEGVERSSPYLGEADVRPRLNNKKSGTFWSRRKSSFGLPLEEVGQEKLSPQQTNSSAVGNRDHLDSKLSGVSCREEERSRSPPPKLPEVDEIYDGGSLGAEDMFSKIS